MKKIHLTLFVVYLFQVATAVALEPRSEHTFGLAEGESAPHITLDDLHWLAGSWTGSIFGQQFEEVWNAPSAGSMMGMFKVFDGDEMNFYELQLITDDGDGLALLVKHFSPAFESWEEKEDFVRFSFVGLEENAIHFAGISFYLLDDNNMEAYILLRFGEEVREELITYQRHSD
jgi:hypothetical protein